MTALSTGVGTLRGGPQTENDDCRIPVLNPELSVGPFDSGRSPGKFIVDIGGRREYEVSLLVHDIIKLIDGKRTDREIAQSLGKTTGFELSSASVGEIIDRFFIPNGFVVGLPSGEQLSEERSFIRPRLPLLSQDALSPLTGFLQALFKKWTFAAVTTVSMAVLIYFWASRGADFARLGEVGGLQLLAAYLIVLLTALVHELGHSSACKYYGAKHGDIGVGLYLFFPVLYADVSGVWNLDRRKRIVVDVGGIYFQTICIPVLCVLYMFFGNTVVLAAIYGTYLTIITALNPFLRFDGYWLVSDLFGVPNLRKRSLEVGREFFRKAVARKDPGKAIREAAGGEWGIPAIAYGGLSTFFFVLFFVQVGALAGLYAQKASLAWREMLENGAAYPGTLYLPAVIDMLDKMFPVILSIVPVGLWAFGGVRYFIRRRRGCRRTSPLEWR